MGTLVKWVSCDEPYARAGDEPAIAELLDDPILHMLLARDHLGPDDLHTAIERGKAALRARSRT